MALERRGRQARGAVITHFIETTGAPASTHAWRHTKVADYVNAATCVASNGCVVVTIDAFVGHSSQPLSDTWSFTDVDRPVKTADLPAGALTPGLGRSACPGRSPRRAAHRQRPQVRLGPALACLRATQQLPAVVPGEQAAVKQARVLGDEVVE